ncbi:hypothetical protein ACFVU3_05280 [Streptomyces sp. NPDC058052]|uniref:hypothetical protein n=1 Tax=Streptomyces sp. NPDC058052 TaxID=3346316 RepID=UPI0036E59B49
MRRTHGAAAPVAALLAAVAAVAVTAGCSSSGGGDEERRTELRRDYCLRLGEWRAARSAEGAGTPSSPAFEKIEPAAQGAFLAARRLQDESAGAGRALSEDTWSVIRIGDAEAETRVLRYCEDAGFETLV